MSYKRGDCPLPVGLTIVGHARRRQAWFVSRNGISKKEEGKSRALAIRPSNPAGPVLVVAKARIFPVEREEGGGGRHRYV